jgi:integrase
VAIYKRGGIWWYGFMFNGQRIQESTKQPNKRVAEQMEAAHRTSLAKGEVGIRERKPVPTLRDFAARFQEAIETQCAEKPRTVEFYKRKLGLLLANDPLATAKLDVIDEAAIEVYKQTRSRTKSRRKKLLSAASVNRELATLRRLLRMAHEWKVIQRVPRIRLLRGEHTRHFVLNREQEKVYLAALPPFLHDIAEVLIDTGLRLGEALSLEWPQVHLEPANGAKFGYVTILSGKAKSKKARNVPLSQRAVDALRRQPARSGYVFTQSDGSEVPESHLDHQHARIRALLKLPAADFVLHSLRHTFGTRLGESGADAFTIMRLMGHSNVTVSQRYVHPSPESIELAYERMTTLNLQTLTTVSTTVAASNIGVIQ